MALALDLLSVLESLGYGRRDESVKLFAVRVALAPALAPTVVPTRTRDLPGLLHVLGLRPHDLARIQIVPRAMEGADRLGLVVFVGSRASGLSELVCSFASGRRGRLGAFPGLLFFVLGVGFTLGREDLLGCLEAFAELHELSQSRSRRIEALDENFALPVARQGELDELDDLVVGEALIGGEGRKVLEVVHQLVDAADEVANVAFSGLEKAPTKVAFLALQSLRRKEMLDHPLDGRLVVGVSLGPESSSILVENAKGFSCQEIPGHRVLLWARRQRLALQDFLQNHQKLQQHFGRSVLENGDVERDSFRARLAWLSLDLDLDGVMALVFLLRRHHELLLVPDRRRRTTRFPVFRQADFHREF